MINFKLKYVRVLLLMIALSSVKLQAQQEPMYSQYMFNMLNINPAFAGNRGMNSITGLYRNQWAGLVGAPVTTSITWDTRKHESNVGYGLQAYSDRLGPESSTGAQAFYSYRLPFETTSLTFGLSAGVMNYYVDFSQFKYSDDKNDVVTIGKPSAILPTVGFGTLFSARNWYAAFSVPSLLRTKIDINNLQNSGSGFGSNFHMYLNAGYNWSVTETFDLKPSILIKDVIATPNAYQLDLNVMAWLQNTIGLGLSYRTNGMVVSIAEIQIAETFRIGYAFDYSMSMLQPYNTHELMIRYEFASTGGRGLRVLSPRYY